MEINKGKCMNDLKKEIPECHLSTKYDIGLNNDTGRAYGLNGKDLPKFDNTTESIYKIIEYLDVENSKRYKRTVRDTFCNVYAHDLAGLMGAYLPRVWWTKSALETERFDAVYLKTAMELNANSLYEWFKKYSHLFGWKKLNNTSEAQIEANKNKCVIMVAANKVKSRSGHITVVIPENGKHKAIGSGGITIVPLQSQAGGTNKKYFAAEWWGNMDPVLIYSV